MRPPDHRILTATAIATRGSNGFHPVSMTKPSPATTPKLVKQSVSTCLPSASRISEWLRFPTRSRYQPSQPLIDGLHQNPDGGDDDHRSFKSGREKRDALVPVKKRRSGGLRAQP